MGRDGVTKEPWTQTEDSGRGHPRRVSRGPPIGSGRRYWVVATFGDGFVSLAATMLLLADALRPVYGLGSLWTLASTPWWRD